MFSETRYAMNGNLRVAYRASGEGSPDSWLVCGAARVAVTALDKSWHVKRDLGWGTAAPEATLIFKSKRSLAVDIRAGAAATIGGGRQPPACRRVGERALTRAVGGTNQR
jgi:hypothetical protein